MRPRAELGLAAGILAVLAVGATMLGSRRARNTDTDPRRSTYLAGPSGASAWAEALGRLGVRVERYRRPAPSVGAIDRQAVFAVIGPAHRLDGREGAQLSALPGDLLLAGEGTDAAMTLPGVSRVGAMGRPRRAQGAPRRRGASDAAGTGGAGAASRDHHRGLVRRLRRPPSQLQRPGARSGGHPASDDQRSPGRDPGRVCRRSDGDAGGRRRPLPEPDPARDRGRPDHARTGHPPLPADSRGRVPPGVQHHGHLAGGRDAGLEQPVALGVDRLAAGRRRGDRAGRLGHPVRTGTTGHPAPAPLAAGARPRARDGARCGARPRDGGAPHGAGASPPPLTGGPGRPGRPRPLARRTGEFPAHRAAAVGRSRL